MDAWENLTKKLVEDVEQQLAGRLRSMVSEIFKSELKIVFSEEEAAAELKVSVDTLQNWRRRKLIECARYPASRIRKDGDEKKLSDVFTYDLAGILSFRQRYIVQAVSPNRFELVPRFSVIGAGVQEKAKGARAA